MFEEQAAPSESWEKKRKLLIKLMQRHFFIRCHQAGMKRHFYVTNVISLHH